MRSFVPRPITYNARRIVAPLMDLFSNISKPTLFLTGLLVILVRKAEERPCTVIPSPSHEAGG